MASNLLYLLPLVSFLGTTSLVQASTLSGIIRQSWASSPQVHGQQDQANLASGDRWRRFIFNEPQVSVANTDNGTAISYGLSLALAFPGKSFAFTQLDSARELQQNAELVGKKQDIAKTLAQVFTDCAGNRSLAKIQVESIQDLSTVQNSLKYLYETGHSSQLDTIQAELQLRQAQSDLLTLQDKAAVSCKRLDETLTAFSITDTLDMVLPDDLDPEIIRELGSITGDTRRAEAANAIAQASFNTAWWSQLPDLTLGAQRNHYLYLPGSPSGLEWSNSYSISLTLPLLFPFRETIEAKRARAQARIDETNAVVQLVTARADQDDGQHEYRRSSNRLRELRRKDLSLAEALRESVLSAYRSGKSGFADLALARKTYSDLKAQEISLQVSIINAHLRCLSRCEGER